MWSFYTLAVMFSLTLIQSIVMFGKSKVIPVNGTHKAITFILIILISFVFWDFFEPTEHQLGAALFAFVVLRAFITFAVSLNKQVMVTKYGYFAFFNIVIYLVILLAYQVYK